MLRKMGNPLADYLSKMTKSGSLMVMYVWVTSE